MAHLEGWARSARGTRRLEHRAAPDSSSKTHWACACKMAVQMHKGLAGSRDVRPGTQSRFLPDVLATLWA